jgi:hypothetical protein
MIAWMTPAPLDRPYRGTLRFHPEALIEQHTNLLFIRSDYLHWFGVYTGTLPGGIELNEAPGVRERHDALW